MSAPRKWLLGPLILLAWLTGVPAQAEVPEGLRQYVADSPEWVASPWMTSPQCQGRGGDFSVYTTHLIRDLPALLAHYQPAFAGTDANAPARKEALLTGFRGVGERAAVPGGYCVDQMARWAVADPGFQPFGFEWGALDFGGQDGVRPYGCASGDAASAVGPCRGFHISCAGALSQQENTVCEAWNSFSDGFVREMNAVIGHAYSAHPVAADCVDCVTTEVKSPAELAQEFLEWVGKSGMQQVVSFVVSGVVKLWQVFTAVVVQYSRPDVGGAAFTEVYNLVAGIALALAFLGWLVTLATAWRRGMLQFTLVGAVKAVLGVTLAGVGAVLMLRLADEATVSLLAAAGELPVRSDFTASLVKVNPLVALLAGIVTALCLVFAVLFLVVHGPLVLMWTLFGSLAAAGQVHPASASWLPRWAGRLAAIAWSKFAMVAVMLLSQRLLVSADPGEDAVAQLVDVLHALVLAALVVACPFLLLELVDIVADRPGGTHAVAGPAASAGSRGALAVGRGAGSAAGAMGGAITRAVRRRPEAAMSPSPSKPSAQRPTTSPASKPPAAASTKPQPAPSPTPSKPSQKPPANRGQVVARSVKPKGQ